MTVGFHAPLPPAPTGVAGYAAALLPALRRRGDVRVNCSRADVHLYHIGNNALHRDIYRRALRRPGVVVLHDAVLHHLLLGSLDRSAYAEEFVYNYGEWNRGLAEELWNGRGRSASDPRYFEYAMLRRIAAGAKTVIVHNPAAAALVRAHVRDVRVAEVPHLFSGPAPPGEWQIARLRQSIGFPLHTFVFGLFGYLRESKRVTAILKVFSELRSSGLDVGLLIAGEFVSSDLFRAVKPFLREPGIVRVGHVPEREFWLLARAVDAGICLRQPAAGETSGIAIRFMGIGKPVFVTDSAETSRFPETICLRIPGGVAEHASLAAHMSWLAGFREAALEIGRRARTYILERHSAAAAADAYWEILETAMDIGSSRIV